MPHEIAVADCPHTHISLDPDPGRGYVLKCHDCGLEAWGAGHVNAARQQFEKKVRSARASRAALERARRKRDAERGIYY